MDPAALWLLFSIFSPVNSSATNAFVVPLPTTMSPRFMARFTSDGAATPFAITRFASGGVRATSGDAGLVGSPGGIASDKTPCPLVCGTQGESNDDNTLTGLGERPCVGHFPGTWYPPLKLLAPCSLTRHSPGRPTAARAPIATRPPHCPSPRFAPGSWPGNSERVSTKPRTAARCRGMLAPPVARGTPCIPRCSPLPR